MKRNPIFKEYLRKSSHLYQNIKDLLNTQLWENGVMGLTERIDLKPLVEAYLFANTPMYLFRHFRENASLRELTQQTSVEALTAEYIDRTRKEWKSIEDIVVAYAILIAITFLEYGQVLTVFESLDLSHLDWGEEIKDIFQTTIDKKLLEQAIETATDFLTIDELVADYEEHADNNTFAE